MTRTYVPAGRVTEHVKPAAVDRTAIRHERTSDMSSPRFGMAEVRDWPTREAMARAIRRGQRTAAMGEWSPIVRLTDGEGY